MDLVFERDRMYLHGAQVGVEGVWEEWIADVSAERKH